jgi:hypothetical protein
MLRKIAEGVTQVFIEHSQSENQENLQWFLTEDPLSAARHYASRAIGSRILSKETTERIQPVVKTDPPPKSKLSQMSDKNPGRAW